MKRKFANRSNDVTNENLEEEVNMDRFFEAVRKGDYSLPKPLRGLFILAVNSSNAKTLTVRMYERPTKIEGAIRKYNLRGINVELETDIDNVESVFDRTFKIMIDIKPFLVNLSMFHKNPIEMPVLRGNGNEKEQEKVEGPEQKLESVIVYRKRIA